MMASTSNVIPTVEITTPRMSKRCWRTRGRRGINSPPAMSVTTTIGTFTRKIEPYQKCSSSAPPTIGPKATAMPDVAPQIPSAFCRSDGSGKTLVRMARLAGKMKAAATPMSARVVISPPVVCDQAAAAENRPKKTRPACMVPLRPRRSPMPPPARSRPAKARLYASTIHCSEVMDAPSVRFSVGRATLTMVLSTTTRKTERQRTGRTIQRRSAAWGAVPSKPSGLEGSRPAVSGLDWRSTEDPGISWLLVDWATGPLPPPSGRASRPL